MAPKRKREKIRVPLITLDAQIQDTDLDAVHVSQEDVEFFQEHGRYSGFLRGLDVDALSRNEIVTLDKTVAALKNQSLAKEERVPQDLDIDSEEEEAEYEREHRQFRISELAEDPYKSNDRLPVKDRQGHWKEAQVQVQEVDNQDDDEDQHSDDSDSELSSAEEDEQKPKTFSKNDGQDTTEPTRESYATLDFAGKKQTIALLATALMEDPETHLGKLKDLRTFGSDASPKVVQLSLLTQLAVYVDILPGYRVRELTEKERNAKVSKEVKKLRKYEEALLQNYQGYLQQLANIAQQNMPPKSDTQHSSRGTASPNYRLLHVAMKCFCRLLETCGHFNFRTNVMAAIVSRMNLRLPATQAATFRLTSDAICRTCCDAMEMLFRDDEAGENSLEAVKLIAKLIKSKNFNVQPRVLDTFLSLHLNDELTAVAGKNKADADDGRRRKGKHGKQQHKTSTHVSKRQKKKQKVDEEIEQEMKEAEAVVDQEEKEKLFTETLKQVFATYFRILKHAPDSILLRSVLQGVAQFGHLISIEYFDGLLAVLRNILKTSEHDLSLVESLYCVITAFTLLSGQGETLTIDLSDFYRFAYRLILEVPARMHDGREDMEDRVVAGSHSTEERQVPLEAEESTVRLVVRCMELIFFKRNRTQLSATRVAAFAKRLLTLTLSLQSPASILAILECIRTLMIRAPTKVHQLFDTEENRSCEGGAYLPELEDPELCQVFATGFWELAALATHWHPSVRSWMQEACSRGVFRQLLDPAGASALAALSRAKAPEEVLQQYSTQGGCAFNPNLSSLAVKKKKLEKGGSEGEAVPLCRKPVDLIQADLFALGNEDEEMDVDVDHAWSHFRGQQNLERKRYLAGRLHRQLKVYRQYFKE